MTDTVLTYKGRAITDLTKNELVDAMTWAFQEIEYQRERADRFLNATALAEPESEGPTHEEVCDLMYEFTIGTGHGERLDEIGFAYALLARWGRTAPAPQPIPVTKRPPLPGEVV